jgi:hypothetical protein
MFNPAAARARCEADAPHVQSGVFCRGCLKTWPCAASFLSAALEALEEAQGKALRLRQKLLRPDKRLHRYDKTGTHQSDCGACDLLAILGESE